jgi:hypothetical protein
MSITLTTREDFSNLFANDPIASTSTLSAIGSSNPDAATKVGERIAALGLTPVPPAGVTLARNLESKVTTSLTGVKSDFSTVKADLTALNTAVGDEKTRAEAAEAAIQTELDSTQTGAGLGTDGAYAANATATYISGATTLKDADNKLDAQAKVNADAIAAETAARTSADTTINTGAGLESDGQYTANAATTYIKTATSLKDADTKLDAQVKANADAIVAEAAARSSASATETATRVAAEAAIQSELDTTQTGAGLGTDGAYVKNESANYISAASSLKDADNKLDAQAKANATAITNEVAARTLAVSNEAAAREAADTAEATARTSAIATETAARTAADTAEATARANADSAIQSELDDTQTGAGLGTDGTYSAHATGVSHIGAATSLHNADKLLDAALVAETTRATNAEVALGVRIDEVISNTDPAALDSLSELVTAFQNADSSLSDSITATLGTHTSELSSVITAVGGINSTTKAYTPPESSNYINDSTSVFDAISRLDIQIKTNADSGSSNNDLKYDKVGGVISGDVTIGSVDTNANITVNGGAAITGNAALSADLTVAGAAQLDTTLGVTGEATFNSLVSCGGGIVLTNGSGLSGTGTIALTGTGSITLPIDGNGEDIATYALDLQDRLTALETYVYAMSGSG